MNTLNASTASIASTAYIYIQGNISTTWELTWRRIEYRVENTVAQNGSNNSKDGNVHTKQQSAHGRSFQLLIWTLTAGRKLYGVYIKSQSMSFVYWLDQRDNVHHSSIRIPGKSTAYVLRSVDIWSGRNLAYTVSPFCSVVQIVIWRALFLFFASSINAWVMGEVHGSTTDASRTHFSYSRWVVSLDIEKLPDIWPFFGWGGARSTFQGQSRPEQTPLLDHILRILRTQYLIEMYVDVYKVVLRSKWGERTDTLDNTECTEYGVEYTSLARLG